MSQTERVIFFQVQNASAKLDRLVETVQTHFHRKEHVLILADDERALAFADELLWKSPPNGFLPHVICEEESQEWIVLAKVKKNLNKAKVAINLCSTPLLIEGPFRIVYDFEDFSSSNKKMLSQIRYTAYRQAGFPIESRMGT